MFTVSVHVPVMDKKEHRHSRAGGNPGGLTPGPCVLSLGARLRGHDGLEPDTTPDTTWDMYFKKSP